MRKMTLKEQWDALEAEVVRLRSEVAQMAAGAGQVGKLEQEGQFTLEDVNAAYERLRANAVRWGVDTGTLWILAGLQEDISRILAGEWSEDAPVAALDNVEPAGDDGISPF